MKTKETEKNVTELAALLRFGSSSKEDIDKMNVLPKSEYNKYSDLAYFMLCSNNGLPIDKIETTINGTKLIVSDPTFSNLLTLFNNDVKAAAYAKAYSFTKEFEDYRKVKGIPENATISVIHILNAMGYDVDSIDSLKQLFGDERYLEENKQIIAEELNGMLLSDVLSQDAQNNLQEHINQLIEHGIKESDILLRADAILDRFTRKFKLAANSPAYESAKDVARERAVYQLKLEYAMTKRKEAIKQFMESMASQWGMKQNDNGSFGDTAYEVDDKILDSNSKTAKQFRINFLNMLNKLSTEDVTPEQFELFSILTQCLQKGVSDEGIIKSCMKQLVELYEGTAVYDLLLNLTGQLKFDKNGIATVSSIKRAKAKLNDVLEKDLDYIHKNAPWYTKMSRMLSVFGNLFLTAIDNNMLFTFLATNAGTIIAYATTGAFPFLGGMIIANAAWGITSFAIHKLLQLDGFDTNTLARQRVLHNAIKKLYLANAINAKIKNLNVLQDAMTKFIIHTLFDEKLEVNTKLAKIIYNNLVTQKKALEYARRKGNSSAEIVNDITRIDNLISTCNTVLGLDIDDSNAFEVKNAYDKLYDEYFLIYMDAALVKADMVLSKMLDDNNININEVMRIKSDVVGSFNAIFSFLNERDVVSQLANSKLTYFKQNHKQQMLSNILNQLLLITNKITNVTDLFLGTYLDKILDKNFKDTVDEKQLSLAKRNLKTLLKNAISLGDVSVLDQFVKVSSTSESLLIRALVNDLQEIDTDTQLEMTQYEAKLNEALKSKGFGKIKHGFNSLINRNEFKKYIEQTNDGLYTTYLVSDVKRGQYLADYSDIKATLLQKFGLDDSNDDELKETEDNKKEEKYNIKLQIDGVDWNAYIPGVNDVVISNEKQGLDGNTMYITKWQAYKIMISFWQAGAEYKKGSVFSEDKMVYSKGAKPRVIFRKNLQYNVIKYACLNKNDINKLSDINMQISKLLTLCQDSIEINGKSTSFPNVAKLDPSQFALYKELMHQKQQLGSIANINQTALSAAGKQNFTSINLKDDDVNIQQAIRFHMWKTIQNKIYNSENYKRQLKLFGLTRGIINESSEQYDDAVTELDKQSHKYDLYRAIIARYDKQIGEATSEEAKNALKEEKNSFINNNTIYSITDSIRNIIKPVDTSENEDTTIFRSTLQTIKKMCRINSEEQFDYSKLFVLDSNGNIDVNASKILWNNLFELMKEDNENRAERNEDEQDTTSDFFRSDEVTVNGKNISSYLYEKLGIPYKSLPRSKSGNHLHGFFYKQIVNQEMIDAQPELYGKQVFDYNPTGFFSQGTDVFADDRYDEDEVGQIQINKDHERYNNQEAYNKIKNDKLYKLMLELLDVAAKNNGIFDRKDIYGLPNMQDSYHSLVGRTFTQGIRNVVRNIKMLWNRFWSPIIHFDARNTDINQIEYMTKSDGTIIDVVPQRYVQQLEDSNQICTNLPFLIMSNLQESIRYKNRLAKQATFDAFIFKLSGGFNRSSDSISTGVVGLLKHNINKYIYGRTTTGSGPNGTLTKKEAWIANLVATVRENMFQRLMANNDMSVLKNGTDSFFNLLTAGIDQRWFTMSNLRHGIAKMGSNILSSLFSYQSNKAANMTQGLMHYNGVTKPTNELYKNLTAGRVYRMFSQIGLCKLELIDYTSKAAITESVYDNYRLVWIGGKVGIYNLQEVIRIAADNGTSGKDAYKIWSKSTCTLRDLYSFDKNTGVVKLTGKIATAWRYNIDTNGNMELKDSETLSEEQTKALVTKQLEHKVRLHIAKSAAYINGMLDTMDKPAIATNYVGCLMTAYRGWMITQYGENQRNGKDFYDDGNDDYKVDTDTEASNWVEKFFRVSRISTLTNTRYRGQLDFTTGYVGTGYTVDQNVTAAKNVVPLLVGIICPYALSINSIRRGGFKNVSEDDMQKVTHMAAGIHFCLLTIFMAAYSCAMAFGGGEPKDDYFWKKTWAVSIANIVESFAKCNKFAFYMNLQDLITAVTVASTYIDSISHINNLLFDDEDELDKVVKNNSFKGVTNRMKHFLYVAKSTGVNMAPTLFVLQRMNEAGLLGSDFRDQDFEMLDLNYRKYHNPHAIIASGRQYSTYTPVKPLQDYILPENIRIIPETQNKSSSSRSYITNSGNSSSGMVW